MWCEFPEMTIYGECEMPGGKLAVRISDLTQAGCDLASSDGDHRLAAYANGDMALWIGAIGPLAATARKRGATRMMASFKEPLDPRILAHFATV